MTSTGEISSPFFSPLSAFAVHSSRFASRGAQFYYFHQTHVAKRKTRCRWNENMTLAVFCSPLFVVLFALAAAAAAGTCHFWPLDHGKKQETNMQSTPRCVSSKPHYHYKVGRVFCFIIIISRTHRRNKAQHISNRCENALLRPRVVVSSFVCETVCVRHISTQEDTVSLLKLGSYHLRSFRGGPKTDCASFPCAVVRVVTVFVCCALTFARRERVWLCEVFAAHRTVFLFRFSSVLVFRCFPFVSPARDTPHTQHTPRCCQFCCCGRSPMVRIRRLWVAR